MTERRDDTQIDSITDTAVTDEMRTSFLEYSMSVIVSRALPDVRDGLKPVHRRILYAMWEAGFRSDRPHRKSATTIGDTMGKYHPHGDSAIYDTLVRMAQPWSLRVPLVDGHGNFGSLDDGPAAARYTEARLSAAGEALLADVEEDTVDMAANFDGQHTEPTVLPAAFPNLLVNGAAGIAVGMATNIPPHNLGEVTAAAQHLLEHPDAAVDDLMVHLPGPDLPGGAQILAGDGIRDAYVTGRGTFKMRATATITDVSARRKGIVVTELPYLIGPERVISKIKEMVNAKRLEGISDVKDLSGRKTGMKLVIECKTGFNPAAVLEDLYRLTPLEESFGVNTLALVDGQPRTLSLVDLLRHYLEHRMEIVRRRSRFRLRKAEARAHILEGLLVALDAIDEVVATIRASKTTESARNNLVKRFKLSQIQATHILDTPLRRLTSLEVTKIRDELADLRHTIDDLNAILGSEQRQREVVSFELDRACDSFATPRRTVLSDAAPIAAVPLEVPDDPCEVFLTATGHLGRIEAGVSVTKGRRKTNVGDLVVASTITSNRADLAVVTNRGRMLRFAAITVPDAADAPKASKLRGVAAGELIELDDGERIVAFVPATADEDTTMLLVTRGGVLKRLAANGWPAKDGLEIISLKDDDEVVAAAVAGDGDDVIMVTSDGRLLRTGIAAVRAQGRTAAGVGGMKLSDDSVVIAAGTVPVDAGDTDTDPVVVTVTAAEGSTPPSAKTSAASTYPTKGRGGGGVRCHTLRKGETGIVAAWIGVGVPMGGAGVGTAVELPATRQRRDASGERLDGTVDVIGVPVQA